MIKILVIDDEKNLLALYEMELADEGYELVVAPNGEEGLRMMKDENPDLIVLDIGMTGMDGIEVLQRMRRDGMTTPVIINTAYSAYKDNVMTFAADDYVVKSGDLTELKEKIAEILTDRGLLKKETTEEKPKEVKRNTESGSFYVP